MHPLHFVSLWSALGFLLMSTCCSHKLTGTSPGTAADQQDSPGEDAQPVPSVCSTTQHCTCHLCHIRLLCGTIAASSGLCCAVPLQHVKVPIGGAAKSLEGGIRCVLSFISLSTFHICSAYIR
jgi:hypothetical protein